MQHKNNNLIFYIKKIRDFKKLYLWIDVADSGTNALLIMRLNEKVLDL